VEEAADLERQPGGDLTAHVRARRCPRLLSTMESLCPRSSEADLLEPRSLARIPQGVKSSSTGRSTTRPARHSDAAGRAPRCICSRRGAMKQRNRPTPAIVHQSVGYHCERNTPGSARIVLLSLVAVGNPWRPPESPPRPPLTIEPRSTSRPQRSSRHACE
jgi:hypothetical protein